MLTYALVDGKLTRPFPKGRGICRACSSPVIAVCGRQVTHHWRHESLDDCDSWSESVGPWHLSWQGLVVPDAVEVPRGEHRADVVGNDGVVIELQHSPIKPDDIEAREAFYGDMVWVFDATFRFGVVESGNLGFFSFGRTKHIDCCQKPVYLDFGKFLLEVTSLNNLIERCHGYGAIRSYEWFASRFLSSVRATTGEISIQPSGDQKSWPWQSKQPFWGLKHPTQWMQPDGSIKTLPKWEPYHHINMKWRDSGEPLTTDFINDHPMIANGWTIESLARMKALISAQTCIIDGKLRLLPPRVEAMQHNSTVAKCESYMDELDEHIAAGRIPVLKDSTKDRLRYLAESIRNMGRPERRKPDEPRLFE